jgi:hypothetical protein
MPCLAHALFWISVALVPKLVAGSRPALPENIDYQAVVSPEVSIAISETRTLEHNIFEMNANIFENHQMQMSIITALKDSKCKTAEEIQTACKVLAKNLSNAVLYQQQRLPGPLPATAPQERHERFSHRCERLVHAAVEAACLSERPIELGPPPGDISNLVGLNEYLTRNAVEKSTRMAELMNMSTGAEFVNVGSEVRAIALQRARVSALIEKEMEQQWDWIIATAHHAFARKTTEKEEIARRMAEQSEDARKKPEEEDSAIRKAEEEEAAAKKAADLIGHQRDTWASIVSNLLGGLLFASGVISSLDAMQE